MNEKTLKVKQATYDKIWKLIGQKTSKEKRKVVVDEIINDLLNSTKRGGKE